MLTFLKFWLRVLAAPGVLGAVIGLLCYAFALKLGAAGAALGWGWGSGAVAFALVLAFEVWLLKNADIG